MKRLLRAAVLACVAVVGLVPAASATEAQAATCNSVKIASKDGRTVYLWRCGSNVHAQLVNASTGDLVFLRTAGGTSLGGARVPSGKTSVNSGSYSLAQTGVVKACVTPTNRSEWCTSYYVAIV